MAKLKAAMHAPVADSLMSRWPLGMSDEMLKVSGVTATVSGDKVPLTASLTVTLP
jgi:hypothetical protein